MNDILFPIGLLRQGTVIESCSWIISPTILTSRVTTDTIFEG